jgi:hypothetical protein
LEIGLASRPTTRLDLKCAVSNRERQLCPAGASATQKQSGIVRTPFALREPSVRILYLAEAQDVRVNVATETGGENDFESSAC